MTHDNPITVETISPRIRTVTFANPPVNVVDPDTVGRLLDVVDELSNDEEVQVAIFTSGTPGLFYNHADLAQLDNLLAMATADSTPAWVELVTRLTNAPFISIASIRGRTASPPASPRSTRPQSSAPRPKSTGPPSHSSPTCGPPGPNSSNRPPGEASGPASPNSAHSSSRSGSTRSSSTSATTSASQSSSNHTHEQPRHGRGAEGKTEREAIRGI
jgi:Enoyl-CoA hydratase/isomerase